MWGCVSGWGPLILAVCINVLAAPAASGWAQEASPVANEPTLESSPDTTETVVAAQLTDLLGGTLGAALPSGSGLPIENPVAIGAYTLTMNAPGYQPISDQIEIREHGTTVTIQLIAFQEPTRTSEPTALPTTTPPNGGPIAALPNTGSGEGPQSGWPLLLAISALAMAVFGILLPRRQRQ